MKNQTNQIVEKILEVTVVPYECVCPRHGGITLEATVLGYTAGDYTVDLAGEWRDKRRYTANRYKIDEGISSGQLSSHQLTIPRGQLMD